MREGYSAQVEDMSPHDGTRNRPTCLFAVLHFQNPVLCSNNTQTEFEDKVSASQNQEGREGILVDPDPAKQPGIRGISFGQAELILPNLVCGPLSLQMFPCSVHFCLCQSSCGLGRSISLSFVFVSSVNHSSARPHIPIYHAIFCDFGSLCFNDKC